MNVRGTGRTAKGWSGSFDGRLVLTPENDCQVEGHLVANEEAPPELCTVLGQSPDGWHLAMPNAEMRGMRMGIRNEVRLAGEDLELWRIRAADHPDRIHETSGFQFTWNVSHAPIVWAAARQPVDIPEAVRRKFNIGFDAIREMRKEAPGLGIPVGASSLSLYYEANSERHRVDAPATLVNTVELCPRVTVAAPAGEYTSGDIDRFRESSEAHVEALLLYLAFVGGDRVVWFERTEQIRDAKRAIAHEESRFRLGRLPTAAARTGRADLVATTVRNSAESAVARILFLSTTLASAVESYLEALEARHGAGQLLLLSTALESLKSLYLSEHAQEHLMPDDQFQAFRGDLEKAMKACWQEEYGPKEIRGKMKAQLSQLNRPPYRDVLTTMCGALGVNLGMYDGEIPFGFIRFRDEFVHSGKISDIEEFQRQLPKLLTLVERVLLVFLNLPQDLFERP